MKKQLQNAFNWLSKHITLLGIVLGGLLTFILTYVLPVLTYKVWIPVWLLIWIFIFPYWVYKIYRFYQIPKKFKGGEQVQIKNFYAVYIILGYQSFSRTIVKCTDTKGTIFYFHQDSLLLF